MFDFLRAFFKPQHVPLTAPVVFIPKKSFFSDTFRSQYVEGLPYTITPDNRRLHAEAKQWELAGLVRFAAPTHAQIRGR